MSQFTLGIKPYQEIVSEIGPKLRELFEQKGFDVITVDTHLNDYLLEAVCFQIDVIRTNSELTKRDLKQKGVDIILYNFKGIQECGLCTLIWMMTRPGMDDIVDEFIIGLTDLLRGDINPKDVWGTAAIHQCVMSALHAFALCPLPDWYNFKTHDGFNEAALLSRCLSGKNEVHDDTIKITYKVKVKKHVKGLHMDNKGRCWICVGGVNDD